jgi:hypothetical protein
MLAVAACVACSALIAARQEPPRDLGRDSARERWERMSPQEREQMHARYEKFKHMDDGERRAIVERWQRLQQLESGTREVLPEAMRRELDRLAPQEQRKAWRGFIGQAWLERGHAMRQLVPQDWRARLERADPPELERMLGEFIEHVRGRTDDALRHLARDLALDPNEVERLRNLAPEEQRAEMFALRRRQIEQRVAQQGLPAGISQQEFDAWKALDARQFSERWGMRMRELGYPQPGDRDRERRFGGRDGERPRPEPGEQLKPPVDSYVGLDQLPWRERVAAFEARRRERALEVLAKSPDLATPDELEALRKLQGREFAEALHAHMRSLGIGLPPRPRGGPPPDGPPPDRPPPEHPGGSEFIYKIW